MRDGSQVSVRTAIKKGDLPQVMRQMPSLRYDTRNDITGLPAMKQVLSWARLNCPMLHSKYIRADAAFFHGMETGKGRTQADKLFKEYNDVWLTIRDKFVEAHKQ